MNERVAIIGTAQSWKKTPWADPGLTLLSLNDAYQLSGWKRADEWYDLHPMSHFFFPERDVPGFAERRPRQMFAHELPPGHYVRPTNHVEWLRQLSIPLWVQEAPPVGWRHAQQFPKAEVETYFGRYFSSTPAWMLAHAIMRGAKEVQIYGIHLATQFEYVCQRPNFEFLIGRVLGRGPVTVTVKDGVRHYETVDGHVVLPLESPIMQASYQYAYQPKPDPWIAPMQWELHKIGVKRARAVKQLQQQRWWSPRTTQDEIARLDALAMDYQQQIAREQLAAQMREQHAL